MRVVLDTKPLLVPSLYASQRLTLTVFADRLCLYHAHNLVASHPRSYERHRDLKIPTMLRNFWISAAEPAMPSGCSLFTL